MFSSAVLRAILAVIFVVWLLGEFLYGSTFHDLFRSMLRDHDQSNLITSQPTQCRSGVVTGSDVCQ